MQNEWEAIFNQIREQRISLLEEVRITADKLSARAKASNDEDFRIDYHALKAQLHSLLEYDITVIEKLCEANGDLTKSINEFGEWQERLREAVEEAKS